MTIVIANDLGRPVRRLYERLSTASPAYYGTVSEAGPPHPPRIWAVEDGHAYVTGITNPEGFAMTWVKIPEGADPVQCILDQLNSSGYEHSIQPMNITPGKYFPRLARPHHQHPGDFPSPFYAGLEFAHERASVNLQIGMLANRLRQCFEVVGPSKPNFEVYGGEFRNILLLAATEVEAQWKGILRANGYDAENPAPRWTTRDYVKIEKACRLADYAIMFPEYPWLEPIAPFRDWDAAKPTSSLLWYDAYNSVKHDREQYGNRATFIRALEAVAAVVVIAVAQFGIQFVRQGARWNGLFQMREYPSWGIGDTHGQHGRPRIPNPEDRMQYPFG